MTVVRWRLHDFRKGKHLVVYTSEFPSVCRLSQVVDEQSEEQHEGVKK